MPEYFVIRSTVSQAEKKWIFDELSNGRLRQGWFAHKVMSLVGKRGALVSEDIWVKKLKAVTHRCFPKPTTDEQREWVSEEFARKRFRWFKRMLAIPEGACIVVPNLDEHGGEEGFALATAVPPPGEWGLSKGCYGFDENPRLSNEPDTKDLRHIVFVAPASVKAVSLGSAPAKEIATRLEKLRYPVQRSGKDALNSKIERLYTETMVKGLEELSVGGSLKKKGREPIDAALLIRQGQEKFRQELLQHYKKRCAISGCELVPTLEAAHIRTYERADVSHITNGLLLRADLHKLFDLGLISVNTSDWTVVIASSLENSPYRELHGKSLTLPSNKTAWPKKALDHHYTNKFERKG
jgi:hypothetical protein